MERHSFSLYPCKKCVLWPHLLTPYPDFCLLVNKVSVKVAKQERLNGMDRVFWGLLVRDGGTRRKGRRKLLAQMEVVNWSGLETQGESQ